MSTLTLKRTAAGVLAAGAIVTGVGAGAGLADAAPTQQQGTHQSQPQQQQPQRQQQAQPQQPRRQQAPQPAPRQSTPHGFWFFGFWIPLP
ncbi:hypothetical protein ACWDPV_00095 [Gordonia sp. NPDC003504]